MKKNIRIAAIALTVLGGLGLGSCKKENITPEGTSSSATTGLSKSYTNYEGIVSNNGYPVTGQTAMGYYSTVGGGLTAVPNMLFGGSTTSTIIGLAATSKSIVFAYKNSVDGLTYLNFGHTAITNCNYADAGTDVPVLLNGVSAFNLAIEEIEIDPISKDVLALVRNGNAIQLYRIAGINNTTVTPGTATAMTYNSSTTIFNNPLGNGYKWGSICFALNTGGTYDLVFTNESTVYAYLGIVSWHYSYNVAANTITALPGSHRTYSVATSGFPAGTGINTTFGYVVGGAGKLFIARNGGNVYSFSLTASNTAATLEYTTTGLSNDFGYWGNH
jgi:hypothetical protein